MITQSNEGTGFAYGAFSLINSTLVSNSTIELYGYYAGMGTNLKKITRKN